MLRFRATAANQMAVNRRLKAVLALDKPAGRWTVGGRPTPSNEQKVRSGDLSGMEGERYIDRQRGEGGESSNNLFLHFLIQYKPRLRAPGPVHQGIHSQGQGSQGLATKSRGGQLTAVFRGREPGAGR